MDWLAQIAPANFQRLVGLRLRRAREAAGLTRSEVASRIRPVRLPRGKGVNPDEDRELRPVAVSEAVVTRIELGYTQLELLQVLDFARSVGIEIAELLRAPDRKELDDAMAVDAV